jgi:acyl-CoA hydrolase
MMDKAAFLAANRFSGLLAVTAASERVEFSTPIRHGMIVDVIARVIHAGRTSMIVEVELFCQEPLDGVRKLATSGYFTMVAVDVAGNPVPVPELLVETNEERERWAIGEEIRDAARGRRRR